MISCDSFHGRPDFSRSDRKAIEFGDGILSCMKHENYIIVDLELPFKKYKDMEEPAPFASLEVHEDGKKHIAVGEFIIPKDYQDIDRVIKRVEAIPGCRMHQIHFHPKNLHIHLGCTISTEVTPLFRDILDIGVRRWQD